MTAALHDRARFSLAVADQKCKSFSYSTKLATCYLVPKRVLNSPDFNLFIKEDDGTYTSASLAASSVGS